MFENIIDQGAVLQLRDDIVSGRNAPSMLFYGPEQSGKGSAALELARVLSCESSGEWKCVCPSCEKHRYLLSEDLLLLGPRSFSADITACSSSFLRNPSNRQAKLLFIRSLRKLILRFSPVVIEEDPKFSKISSVLHSLDENLNDFWSMTDGVFDEAAVTKLCNSLIKNANVLESEGVSANIPIGHVRSASYWCRLAPNGKSKTLIIENAQNMRDEARNSLLKLLEEPPASVNIVLTAKRREAIMPTILSRLRPYRFLKRDTQSDKEIIRRVFQDNGSCLNEYLDSFMPQSTEKLYPLAAWFIVSLARVVSVSIKKKRGGDIPSVLNALGERYAPIAEKAGFEKCLKSSVIIKTIVTKSGNFEDESFSRFMKICMDLIKDVTRHEKDPQYIKFNDIIKRHTGEAVTAVDVLNINSTLALESLFYNIKTAVTSGL